MTQSADGKRDLVLAPGEYAYLQDETRGMVKTFTGPTVINQTAQDRPVVYDQSAGIFKKCQLEQAVQKSPLASEGDYIVLENPAADHPEEGQSRPMPTLNVGRKINIPGPCNFALWPGQKATVINGHHLRSNQYLLVRIYNEKEAKANWNSAVAVSTSGEIAPVAAETLNLTIGKLLVIKGTEVSFYIPPTGVEVIAENQSYVREAVTLERLEYAILVDENGNKRYEKGPQVVFPKPTENFLLEKGSRKFRSIELNKIQGLYVKVIADYQENGHEHKIGDELFITGADTPIYYPRVEHSVITYGEQQTHNATAIPAGEGRYVMNRDTGEIRTEKGPNMLLCDPRKEVQIRRILSDKQVSLWYPNNQEALSYNRNLRNLTPKVGFVAEGAYQQNLMNFASNAEGLECAVSAALPDTFTRSNTYAQPRTITLETKYDGVPSITVWTGYAVMVVSKTGNRRVVKGPATVLLDYDESLEVLELSTGKPKTTDKLEKTVYLRTANNKVSDVVRVITKDQVAVDLSLSYRVNFDGDTAKWFEVENYVKFLCDHCRSVLKGRSQKRKIEEFHTEGVEIIRDAILGRPSIERPDDNDHIRPGMKFEENKMYVSDVEVLGIKVADESIHQMLDKAQHDVVRSNIELHLAEKKLEVIKKLEEINREKSEAEALTAKRKSELESLLIAEQLIVSLTRIKSELEIAGKNREVELAREGVKDVVAESELQRRKLAADQDLAIERIKQELRLTTISAETESTVKRFGAAQAGFSEALLQMQSQETLTKIAEAGSIQRILGGKDFVEVLAKIFQGSGLEGLLSNITGKIGTRPSIRS